MREPNRNRDLVSKDTSQVPEVPEPARAIQTTLLALALMLARQAACEDDANDADARTAERQRVSKKPD